MIVNSFTILPAATEIDCLCLVAHTKKSCNLPLRIMAVTLWNFRYLCSCFNSIHHCVIHCHVMTEQHNAGNAGNADRDTVRLMKAPLSKNPGF